MAIGTFSCVVDENPRFHADALRWFASLTLLAGVDPTDLVVNVVGSPHSAALDYLDRRGVSVEPVQAFDPRSRHCNKISGALNLAQMGRASPSVLCDADIAIVEDPRRLIVPDDAVGAKPVDGPHPPVKVLKRIFSRSGLASPPVVRIRPRGKTLSGNSNGGLYIVPAGRLAGIAEAWSLWARWLLDRLELLGQWKMHVDQVSMAMAIASEGLVPVALDGRWNTPTHDPALIPRQGGAPAVIHYHTNTVPNGCIERCGVPAVDVRVGEVNRAISEVLRDVFPSTRAD